MHEKSKSLKILLWQYKQQCIQRNNKSGKRQGSWWINIHLMFERRVYPAKLRRLVLQLVHYQASLSCGNHGHGIYLHMTVREVKKEI